jgi:excisionase family DNA binding protein
VPNRQRAELSADTADSRPWTKEEVCEFLRISNRTLDNYIKSRRIRYIKLGRNVRFRFEDIQRTLNHSTVEAVTR